MARSLFVPYPELEPAANPPSDYQQIQTSPDMFGAQVGRALERAGSQFQQTGNDMLEFYNKVSSDEATNNLLRETDKILYGDPNDPSSKGYLALEGKDALDAYPRVSQQLQALREQAKAGLRTPGSQLAFDHQTMFLHRQNMRDIGKHNASQMKTWASGVALGQADLALDGIARASLSGDDTAVERYTHDFMDGRIKAAQMKYGTDLPPEIYDDVLAKARIDATVRQIEAIEPTDPDRALRLFEANRDTLARSPRYDAIASKLRHRTTDAQGDALANGALGLAPMPTPRTSGFGPSDGSLWSRIKGAEGGLGRNGEALVSPKGAIGVSQIIPSTAREMASDLGLPYDERRLHTDQAYNERLGKGYLDKMLNRYGGNEALAAAAYNAGPDRVDNWLRTIGDPRTGEITDADFAQKIPIAETRGYVRKIIAGTPREAPKTAAPANLAASAGGEAPNFGVAFGDSIAVQQIRHGIGGAEAPFKSGGLGPSGSTARVGDSPQQVLDRLGQSDPSQFAGQTVFLSTGASNNPDQVALAADQIDKLKAAGARAIIIPGVGPGVKNAAQVNAELSNIAKANGAIFFQPQVKWQKDGVHPAEVDKLREQGLAAAATRAQSGGDGTAPASGAGTDQATGQPPPEIANAPPMPTGPMSEEWRRVWQTPGFSDEVRKRAWENVQRYRAEQHRVEEAQQAQATSDLTLAVMRGEKSRSDIEDAYAKKLISPATRTHLNLALDKVDADRAAQAEAMARVGAAGSGGPPLDPKSKEDKDALNLHYNAVSQTWPADQALDRAINYATQYGMVPDKLKAMVRGGLHSGRPDQAVLSAQTIDRLRNANPQLIGDIGDENDLRLAATISSYASLGVPPDQAVNLAVEGMKVNKADREARAEDFKEQRGKTERERQTSDDKWIRGQQNSIWTIDPSVDPIMRKEFEIVSQLEYQRTGNLDAARRLGLDSINRVWGRSQVGGNLRYMKFAPEKFYGVPTLTPDQNSAWMNEQLLSDVSKGALQDPNNPLTAERLRLLPAPDKARPDGLPVYQVWLVGPDSRWQQVVDTKGAPVTWFPDWNKSAARKRIEDEKQGKIEAARQLRAQEEERRRENLAIKERLSTPDAVR